jgi:cation diffusion facilitator family transporter
VVGAVVANFAIALVKLLAAIAGGSSAMLSEAAHSGIDGVNDLLLLLGIHRSKRPADGQHPFGYGKELYFWSLLVSCSVLAVGGGVTVVEGVRHLVRPEPVTHAAWAYGALGCGALFDAGSLWFSVRQFRKQNRGKALRRAVRETKDPGSLMVVAEDTAALTGEALAAAGVFASTHGLRRGDGIGSVSIGLLLGCVAVFLITQMRDLIVGEGVEDEISGAIKNLAVGPGRFRAVRSAQTMHFGPETVLVTITAEFDPERRAADLIEAVHGIQGAIRERYPAVRYVFVDPERHR